MMAALWWAAWVWIAVLAALTFVIGVGRSARAARVDSRIIGWAVDLVTLAAMWAVLALAWRVLP